MNYCILFIVLFCSLLHGTLSAATSVDFSKDSLIHFPLLNQEEDQIRIEKSKIPGKEKTGISFSWGTRHYHYTQTGISKKPLPQFEKFQKLELALNVFIEPGSSVSQFGLRFRDSQGEIFQISSGRLPAGTHGNQKVHLVFDAEKVPHSWGKKINRKIDWPLTLFSMTVSYPPQSGKGKIIFESIETFLPDRLLESVEVKVDTGHPLHLLFPRKAPPQLSFRNTLNRSISFLTEWNLSDFSGKNLATSQERLNLSPGNSATISIPWKQSLGIFYVNYKLKATDGSGEFAGKCSFASINPPDKKNTRENEFLFGVCSHPGRINPEEQELEALAASLCGARYLRTGISWESLERKKGKRDYSRFDRVVDTFLKHGIETQILLAFTPRWAVSKEGTPVYPKDRRLMFRLPDYDAYASFAEETARRYQGKLRFFEIWNEPDIAFGNFTTEQYIKLLRAGYEGIKRGNPEAKVMTAGFTYMPLSDIPPKPGMMRRTLVEGKGFYDIHAFHGHGPFAHYRPQIPAMLEMRRKEGITAPWYANETADHSLRGEAHQAVTLFQKLIFSWANGAMGYNWYDLRNDGYDRYEKEHNFGMITRDFQPKAVYPVYSMLTNLFAPAHFRKTLSPGGGIYLYQFETPDAILLPLWREDGSFPAVLALRTDARKAEVVDLMGNRKPLTINSNFLLAVPEQTPCTLLLHGAKNVKFSGFVLKFFHPGLQIPGTPAYLPFVLRNPFPEEQAFQIWSGKHHASYSLKGGTAQNVRLQTDSPEFRWKLGKIFQGKFLLEFTRARMISAKAHEKPDFVLDREKNRFELFPNNPLMQHMTWKGPKDLSAKIWLQIRKESLLLDAEVTDDTHVQPYSKSMVWQGDNIQIAFCFPNQTGNWEIGLTRLESGKAEVFFWDTPVKANPSAVKLSTERRENRTLYHAAFPFSLLGIKREDLALGFRFNLLVNDNDGNGRKGWMEIAPGLGIDKSPERFPVLIFPGTNISYR